MDGPTASDIAAPGGSPAGSDWSRVVRVEPGTEVFVTVQGSAPQREYLLLADESALTLLTVDDPAIPASLRRLLLEMASTRASDIADARNGRTFVENNVRVGPDGVFEGEQKGADLGQIVRAIPRTAVVEIRGPVRTRGSKIGAVVGVAGGIFAGTLSAAALGYKQCGRSCDDERVLMALSLVGIPIAGGIAGFQAFKHRTQDLIYSARP
jgi:hypothetical protein